jgi:acyl-CoA thioesterase FadM
MSTAKIAESFIYTRRVTFPEADPAGIAHFSNFARWVEEAEAAFWREHAVAASSNSGGVLRGFPKVVFTIRFRSPVRFDDEIAIGLRPEVLPASVVKWHFSIRRGETLCASGEMTVVYAESDPRAGELRRIALPPAFVAVLNTAGAAV